MKIHEQFAEEYGITFPLLSDPNGLIKDRYGPGRITFVIDREGVVRHIQKGVPKNKELLKEIRKLGEGP